ncbi:hypothetical protein CDEST_04841 [Colletotrichum destructivum]|uniref:Uncharacterized protein n=1 Tax=Colletotrichum destructivum TaxID=34406 RepID=A0AAX4I8V3_9PEZI|nr:hypothetical protein CDEST_04841 [Colletotrichum destructivum]
MSTPSTNLRTMNVAGCWVGGDDDGPLIAVKKYLASFSAFFAPTCFNLSLLHLVTHSGCLASFDDETSSSRLSHLFRKNGIK